MLGLDSLAAQRIEHRVGDCCFVFGDQHVRHDHRIPVPAIHHPHSGKKRVSFMAGNLTSTK